jgi:hypothetical protein
MSSEVHNPDQPELSGEVEIDGMYTGGNIKPANKKAERIDRRTAEVQTGKRQVVVIARERIPLSVRERNGVARGSSARAERAALPPCHQGGSRADSGLTALWRADGES